MDGFLLIDKPDGITSHDVVDRLRRITGIRKIGHAGTLDPFATGLLVVGIGRAATKRLGEISGTAKEYVASAKLGAASDTQDRTGVITASVAQEMPTREALLETMAGFMGKIRQVPPMFSAKKIGGKKLYELARKGVEVERAPVEVEILALELLKYDPPMFEFRTLCSSGTYVRTLAHDMGAKLGVGAYLEELRRTKVGGFRVTDALPLDALTTENWHGFLLPADLPA